MFDILCTSNDNTNLEPKTHLKKKQITLSPKCRGMHLTLENEVQTDKPPSPVFNLPSYTLFVVGSF